MQGTTPPPLYDVLFDFTCQMCEKFPQFTPLSMRRESAKEVCILLARFITKTAKDNAANGSSKQRKSIKVGNKVYYEDNGGDWAF